MSRDDRLNHLSHLWSFSKVVNIEVSQTYYVDSVTLTSPLSTSMPGYASGSFSFDTTNSSISSTAASYYRGHTVWDVSTEYSSQPHSSSQFTCMYGISEQLANAIMASGIGEQILAVLGDVRTATCFVQSCPLTLRGGRARNTLPHRGERLWCSSPMINESASHKACYAARGIRGCESLICSLAFPRHCMGTVIQFRNRDVYCGSYFDYLAGRALLMSLREIFSGRSGDMLSPSQRRVAGRPVPVNTYKTFYHREWDIVSIFRTILRAGVFYLRIARDQKHSSIATEYQLYTDNDCLVQMPVKVPLTLFAAMCDKYAYSFAALNLIAQAIDSERNTARPVLPKPAEDGPAAATGPM